VAWRDLGTQVGELVAGMRASGMPEPLVVGMNRYMVAGELAVLRGLGEIEVPRSQPVQELASGFAMTHVPSADLPDVLRRTPHHQQGLQLAELLASQKFFVRDAADVGEAAGEIVDVARRRIALAGFGEERSERREEFLARAQFVQVEQALGAEAGFHFGEPLRFGLVDLVEPGGDQETGHGEEQEFAPAPGGALRGYFPYGGSLDGSAAGDRHI
jgi:hypothetical protein